MLAATKAIKGIKAKISKAQKKIKALTLEIQAKTKIAKENKKLEELIKAMEQKIKKKQEGEKELSELVARLSKIYETKSDELKKQNSQTSNLENELAEFNRKTKKTEDELNDELKETKEKVKTVEKDLSAKKLKLKSLEKEYAAFKVTETQKKATQIAAAKAEGDKRIAAKRSELDQCQKSLKSLKGSISSLKMDLNNKISQINNFKSRGKKLLALFNAKSLFITKQSEIDNSITSLRSQIETACRDIDGESLCNSLNDQLATFAIQSTELYNQIEDSLESFGALLENRSEKKIKRIKDTEKRDTLTIIKAYYADLDVTSKVTAAIKDNELTIQAINQVFTDPMVGYTKTLVVGYRFGQAMPELAMAKEGETLKITYKRNQRPYTPTLNTTTIFGGYYGTQDVKSQLKTMVANGDAEIKASNQNFGDPMPGTVKTLVIGYFDLNGTAKVDVAREGKTITLYEKIPDQKTLLSRMIVYILNPTTYNYDPSQLIFIGAFYGTQPSFAEVNALMNNNALSFTVTDSLNAQATEDVNPKTLALAYRYGNGKPNLVIVPKNSKADIQAGSSYTDYVPPAGKTDVIKAFYGLVDVTTKVKAAFNSGATFKVTNANLDNSDQRSPKLLMVLYTLPTGHQCLQMVREGDYTILAPPVSYFGL